MPTSGPIVRTGATPEFWKNWEQAFGGKKKTAPAKAAPAKAAPAKAAAKKKATAAKKPAAGKSKTAAKRK
jgi:hypothetical protein